LNEIDHAYEGPALGAHVTTFLSRYLNQGPDAIDYPYRFVAPNNTGMLTGLDVDGNGVAATDADRGTRAHGDDAYGFGEYPGQFSMALLSRLPVDAAAARTFQHFLWRDLPDTLLPEDFYSATVARVFRLSSKSHWDVPVQVGRHWVHVLASHPTPPVFDGPEDRNGRRNFDEIGFWARYIDGSPAIRDDTGLRGGLPAVPFVVVGDLNARPDQAESIYRGQRAIEQLLRHPRLRDAGPPVPTADFAGGARVDYVIPSVELLVVGGGVFWPDASQDPAGAAMAEQASDHRLVWLDLRVAQP
jgi:hypothetical protein